MLTFELKANKWKQPCIRMRLNQSPMDNDLLDHDLCIEITIKTKITGFTSQWWIYGGSLTEQMEYDKQVNNFPPFIDNLIYISHVAFSTIFFYVTLIISQIKIFRCLNFDQLLV